MTCYINWNILHWTPFKFLLVVLFLTSLSLSLFKEKIPNLNWNHFFIYKITYYPHHRKLLYWTGLASPFILSWFPPFLKFPFILLNLPQGNLHSSVTFIAIHANFWLNMWLTEAALCRQIWKLTRTVWSLFPVKGVSMLFQALMVKFFGPGILQLKGLSNLEYCLSKIYFLVKLS